MKMKVMKICRHIFLIVGFLVAGVTCLGAKERVIIDSNTDLETLETYAWKGKPEAMFVLGDKLVMGKGVAKDLPTGMNWVRRAAYMKHPKAMAAYGGYILRGWEPGVPRDAFSWFYKAASKGEPMGQYNLAYCYDNGYGTQQNFEKAAQYYELAYKAGIIAAANNLGVLYYNGHGVAQDYNKAFNYFLESAEQENSMAYMNVGRCYVTGNGTPSDPEKGMVWFEKAAESGNKVAIFFCGMVFYRGDGYLYEVEVREPDEGLINYPKAVKYLSLTLESDVPDYVKADAARNLSACYRHGRGVEANEELANELLVKAADYGHPDKEKILMWLEK